MYLKRLFAPRTDATAPPQLVGVRVMRSGRIWNVDPRVLDAGETEGWISRARGQVILHGEKGDVVFRIAERPGLYCSHCDVRLGDVGEPNVGREHVASAHAGVASPDPQNPAGYRGNNAFTLVLVGEEVTDMTQEEAATMAKGVREALAKKIRPKFADARGAAERRLRAKTSNGKEG